MRSDPVERFWRKVDKRGPDDCWIWLDHLAGGGYGQFRIEVGVQVAAHRFAYQDLVGPIPAGLTLDHLCRIRSCVNPAHLEPVTGPENTRRGSRSTATHCKRGHPFDERNTRRTATGGRVCRRCHADREVRYREALNR